MTKITLFTLLTLIIFFSSCAYTGTTYQAETVDYRGLPVKQTQVVIQMVHLPLICQQGIVPDRRWTQKQLSWLAWNEAGPGLDSGK